MVLPTGTRTTSRSPGRAPALRQRGQPGTTLVVNRKRPLQPVHQLKLKLKDNKSKEVNVPARKMGINLVLVRGAT